MGYSEDEILDIIAISTIEDVAEREHTEKVQKAKNL